MTDGIASSPNGSDRINVFALVSYISGPLGEFLDRLRKELVPGCVAQPHVTVMPPRPLLAPVEQAWRRLAHGVSGHPSFDLEATDIRVFSFTNVVYIDLGHGRERLVQIHDALSREELAFEEPFPYHPHITLAQEITAEDVAAVSDLARRRWAEFSHPRRFPVEKLTFVQNTVRNRWLDLGAIPLARP